jgi:membrane protease YdiL (CAAX protease family)
MKNGPRSSMQTTQPDTRRVQILIGLLLTLGVGNLPLGVWGERLRVFGPLVGHELLWWIAIAVVLLYVLLVERRPLSSIGLRRIGFQDFLLAILCGILMIAGAVVIYSMLFPRFHLQLKVHEFNRLMGSPFWYRFIVVLRVAIAEEILLRVYPFERLDELTGSRSLAAIIPWVGFTIAHLKTWGLASLLGAGFYGVMLTLLYVWRRNLASNLIAHWILDAAVYLLP